MTEAAVNFAGLKVAIIENEYTSMQGLKNILEKCGCHVVWTARNEDETLSAFAEQKPRVAFVDLRLEEPSSGWELIKQLGERSPRNELGLIIYSSAPVNSDIVLEAIRKGCSYIIKEDMIDREEAHALISAALKAAISRSVILSSEVASSLESVIISQNVDQLLTEKEWEVLRLLSEGLSNREIAKRQFVAISTVKTQVSSVLSKLELRNRVQAAEWYRKQNQ